MTKSDAPRILIPIDLHGVNRTTLETLVRIARLMNRGLLGLLLEDIRLQQVAALPFTTEITLSGAQERSLLRDHLSQRYQQVSADTRLILLELAERNRVELSFEEALGRRLHSALERDGHLDIFFPSRRSWQLLRPDTGRGRAAIRRLGLLLGDAEDTDRAVETARLLVSAGLVGDIYILSHGSPPVERLQPLYRPRHRLCVQSSFRISPAAITALIRQPPYDLLLLPRSCLEGIPVDVLDAALEKSSGQILVVH